MGPCVLGSSVHTYCVGSNACVVRAGVVEERQRTGFAQPGKAKGGLTSLAVPHGKAVGKMSL